MNRECEQCSRTLKQVEEDETMCYTCQNIFVEDIEYCDELPILTIHTSQNVSSIL